MKTRKLSTIIIVFLLAILGFIYIKSEKALTNLYKEKEVEPLFLPISMLDVAFLKNRPAISEFYLISAIMHFVSENRDTEFIAKELYLGYKADPYIKETVFFLGNVLPIKKEDIEIANRYLRLAASYGIDWHIFLYMGYNFLFNLKEYEKAARFFYIASKLPGAKPYVQSMLIMAYYRKNDIRGALLYLTALYKETENPARKKLILKKIEWLQNIIELNEQVKLFYKKEGRYPKNLKEMVDKGYIQEIPKDPFGRGYYFDKKAKIVKSKW